MNEKTNFGLSVSILGTICFIMAYYSVWATVGLMIVMLLLGSEAKVKYNAVQAVLLALAFVVFRMLWGGFTDLFGMFPDFNYYPISNVINGLINIAEKIVTLGAALLTFLGVTVNLPIISNIAHKNLQE